MTDGSYGAERAGAARSEIPLGTGETVLLVDDERPIRMMLKSMLERLGYHVLAADSAETALDMAVAYTGRIHLLLTDICMPRMNGRELAEVLARERPDLSCIFMSGFPPDDIFGRGLLEREVHFMAKPFSRDQLAFKTREVLDAHVENP